MNTYLSISVRFLQPCPLFHGRGDAEQAEWPPSPLRLFQSLLNAASLHARGQALSSDIVAALRFLETTRPLVVAPPAALSAAGYRAYVPHNQADLVTAAWHRGNYEESIAKHRIEKDHRPMRIDATGDELPAVHYIYALAGLDISPELLLAAVRPRVRSIYSLGWGIDQVAADAAFGDAVTIAGLAGERFYPAERGGRPLRVPRQGTLEALQNRYERFLARLVGGDWTPVPPLTEFGQSLYRSADDPVPRPHVVYRLVNEDGDTVAYPQAKLVHIAGMIRHLAIDRMRKLPPGDLRGMTREQWVERYVAGHRTAVESADYSHTQFSFLPLQSLGASHADPGVRRIMIVAPLGDDAWLAHLAEQLDGAVLKPDPKCPNTTLPQGTKLERIFENRKDGVRDAYLNLSRTWASVTPVILPGHDDHKPDKTRKLIVKALVQSGFDQPCEYEWSAFSQFRKMLGAHKYRIDPDHPEKKIPINYIRPDHLLDQTAVHIKLSFPRELPGPLTLGAGRHCGFGIFAAVES